MNEMALIRRQFNSITQSHLHYLDSAATTLKPKAIAQRVAQYYNEQNGSPHRGAHRLSVVSTQLYDQSKQVVRSFIGARAGDEIIYTRGTTEALNLIAASLPIGCQNTPQSGSSASALTCLAPNEKTAQTGQSANTSANLAPQKTVANTVDLTQWCIADGDKIVIAISAHHSNILPWQRLAARSGASLEYMYTDNEGQIMPAELDKIDARTKIVSLPLISNGNGVVHPAPVIFKKAASVGALTIADAAQAVGHIDVNFEELGCDFLAFSGHKLYAPQGIGVLVGKRTALELLSPYQLGGDMIEYVSEQSASFADIPERFEAGTQNVAGAVGLMAAIEWLGKIGLDKVYAHNSEITAKLYTMLAYRSDIEVYGPIHESGRGSIVTFNVKGVHPHDVATILDAQGVAIRAGHHCCQPYMHYAGTQSTCRASVGIYTNEEDIAALEQALDKVSEVFKRHA